jgi:signal peptidase II
MQPKLRVGLVAFVLALGLDLITKYLVETHLHYGEKREVVEGFFYLTHVRNPGAAFGLFATAPAGFRLAFFVGISVVAIGIILSFFRKLAPGDRLSALALGSILGGALGNLIDRVRYGEVVDFLHFELWKGYSWPDFNLADSCIVVGVALLVLELLASEGSGGAAPRAGEEQTRRSS